jgi:Domain of unknown function (DUF4259)
MAGWGTGSFENEVAHDFLGRLKSLGIDDLRQILARAEDQEGYLEARESSDAIAAAEVVAALVVNQRGGTREGGAKDGNVLNPGVTLPATPQPILDWIDANRADASSELVDLARRAVERVRTNSELKDLWLEADGLNEWNATLRGLKERLSG